VLCVHSGISKKAELSSTPPRPSPNQPSLPVQLSVVKTDVSPVDKKPPTSSVEKPVSSERRTSSDHTESTKRPASSVAMASDQPVAKRPMASSSGDGIMTVSTSSCKTSITPVSVPHKRAPSFEAEGFLCVFLPCSILVCVVLVVISHSVLLTSSRLRLI